MKSIVILAMFIASPFFVKSQYLEIGAMGGTTNYLGDLAPTAFSPSSTLPAGGFFVKLNLPRFVSIRAHYMRGGLAGNDKHSLEESRRIRNLHFKTTINEWALLAEFNLFGYEPERLRRQFTPFGYFGIAVFNFNPQTEYQNVWYDLQPLGTEGQGIEGYPKPYALTQFAIPFGGGLKYAIDEHLNLSVEFGFRKTFTDYIDDVSTDYVFRDDLLASNGELAATLANRTGEYLNSEPMDYQTGIQRGDPKDNDWYLYGAVSVSYNFIFIFKKKKWWKHIFRKKKYGCTIF